MTPLHTISHIVGPSRDPLYISILSDTTITQMMTRNDRRKLIGGKTKMLNQMRIQKRVER